MSKGDYQKIQIHNLKSAIIDYDEAIKINSRYFLAYLNRGLAKMREANKSRGIKSKILCYENANEDSDENADDESNDNADEEPDENEEVQEDNAEEK